MEEIFEGVYKRGKQLFTYDGKRYRAWNPYRSKMAAAILKGLKEMPIKRGSNILYLGVATGTTASHLSDIVQDGRIYGVEISFKAMKKFVELCKERKNLIPILADASKPDSYAAIVEEVDLIYQDISQKNQVEIFLKNMEEFDVRQGIIMVKARSIDVATEPKKVFKNVRDSIEKFYRVRHMINLSPYAKDHVSIIVGPP